MNILISADYGAQTSGNFIASLIELGELIKAKGDNVVYAFPKPLTKIDYPWLNWFKRLGFETVLVDYYDTTSDMILNQLSDIVSKYNINLIHTHFSMFRDVLIKNRSKFKKLSIVVHDHMDFNVYQSDKIQRVKFAVLSLLYRALNINVITVMSFKKSTYTFLKNKCWHIPNGISLKRNVDVSETREDCRKRLGIKDNDVLCLVLGWDTKRKGIDIAMKAVTKYQQDTKHPMILGVVGFSSSPSKNQLDTLSQLSGINADNPHIKYLDNCEDMYAYHRASDVYLSSSRKEAFSYGLLEAISQEKPIAVSDISGTTWSHEYTNCFVYPVEDAEACAKTLYKAYSESKPETNSAILLGKYDINKWCEKVYNVYKKVK
ncbi:MAG: glycosyltransferase family 4 protein [Clostridia bacterium]|nr:glycosyltransferase family 4 protein [Clostridia bacterium]